MDINLNFSVTDNDDKLNIILRDNGYIEGDTDKLVNAFKGLDEEKIKKINTQISPIDLIVLWMFYRLVTRQNEMKTAP